MLYLPFPVSTLPNRHFLRFLNRVMHTLYL
nr:MAG TPA: hypothetical protein [Caudoviricetes sp.]